MKKKIVIVINIAGLSPKLLKHEEKLPNITKLKKEGIYRKMDPGFPALTCPVQATLLSGKPPKDHGIVGNGYFDRENLRPQFWRQENSLVNGPRIWDVMKEKNPESKIAVFFWQNSKYINADFVVTPSPLHTDKGIIEWCYSKPPGFYEELVKKLGKFELKSYWGPFANEDSSRWIVEAALCTLKTELPDLLLLYIPHLDYFCQRFKPDSREVIDELPFIDSLVSKFLDFRESYGRDEVVIFIVSEYGFSNVEEVVYPNRILRENGLLKVREIDGEYIDYELSDAFALVDHQIAHIYCKPKVVDLVRKIFEDSEGISDVVDREGQRNLEIDHDRSGELIISSSKNGWFSYYYWFDESKLPFFARNVDIHNKPGYDPCELFFEDKGISLDPGNIRGSHGLPPEDENQFAVMMSSNKDLEGYVPKDFHSTQFLAILYREI